MLQFVPILPYDPVFDEFDASLLDVLKQVFFLWRDVLIARRRGLPLGNLENLVLRFT